MVVLNEKIIKDIEDYFNDFTYELGGALGIKDGIVSTFIPVKNISKEKSSYIPSFDMLNDVVIALDKEGIEFYGIIHSHAVGFCGSGSNLPSKQDIEFFNEFMKENSDYKELLFPIITLKEDKKIISWYKFKDGKINEEIIDIL